MVSGIALQGFMVSTCALINALYREGAKPIRATAAKYAHFCIFGRQKVWLHPQIRLSNALEVDGFLVNGFCFARMGQLLAFILLKRLPK